MPLAEGRVGGRRQRSGLLHHDDHVRGGREGLPSSLNRTACPPAPSVARLHVGLPLRGDRHLAHGLAALRGGVWMRRT